MRKYLRNQWRNSFAPGTFWKRKQAKWNDFGAMVQQSSYSVWAYGPIIRVR